MDWRILIVEDNAVMAESLKQALLRDLGEAVIEIVANFAEAPKIIARIKPDVAIFDIYDDQIEEHPEAAIKPAWQTVWNTHFCPVVFHTGHEVEEYKNIGHPFARYEIKGPESHGRVVKHIKDFKPEIEGLRTLRHELERSVQETLVHVSPLVWKIGKPKAELPDMLLRAVRRRMAATLDYPTKPLTNLQAWEQYICPPIGDNLLTGDLIRITNKPATNPQSYHLVLSPSCDLVLGRGNALEHVLVAGCVPVSKFVERAMVSTKKIIKDLPAELTKEQVGGLMVLPAFADVIPLMAANLKKLSHIPYVHIATKIDEKKPFTRIASLDSPFRERLAWAYLQVAGRPGVPDVDVQSLATAISQAITASTKA
ncbi:MAG: response regulator [Nitrospira sp.]|nr:MAG: response regulator [Nitrospira sp.]